MKQIYARLKGRHRVIYARLKGRHRVIYARLKGRHRVIYARLKGEGAHGHASPTREERSTLTSPSSIGQ